MSSPSRGLFWTGSQRFPSPTGDTLMPDLAYTQNDAGTPGLYLTQVSSVDPVNGPYKVQAARLSPLPRVIRDLTTTGMSKYPAITAWESLSSTNVLVVWDGDDSKIHSRRSSDAGDTWAPDVLVTSSGAGAPVLASHGRFAHVAWLQLTATPPTVLYKRSNDFGASWDATTLFLVGSVPSGHSSPDRFGIAAHGLGVTVTHVYEPTGWPVSRRNTHNGEADAWLQPDFIEENLAERIKTAVDGRQERAGTKRNTVQYLWERTGGGYDVFHTRRATTEVERQATTYDATTPAVNGFRGQGIAFRPAVPAAAFVFGGERDSPPTYLQTIWNFDLAGESMLDTGYALPDEQRAYMSAAWDGTKAWVFAGRKAAAADGTAGTSCVSKYDDTASPTCQAASSQWSARYGTSAVFDSVTGFAYVFGGKVNKPAGVTTYFDEIRKFNTATEQFEGWGSCAAPTLPAKVAHTAAAWDSVQRVAYLFGGETSPTQNHHSVIKVDPKAVPCPTVQVAASIPAEPWEVSRRPGPGTTAVYAGSGTVYVVGGRWLVDPVIGDQALDFPYVYSFQTATNTFSLQYVDLPACKSYGAAFWDAAGSRMYYFGGYTGDLDPAGGPPPCGAAGKQVVRYVEKSH